MDADDERFDSDGDFYGRGKDTFVGPVANADDIAKFLVSAGNAEQFDGNASVDKALERLGLRGQYQLLPGMAVSLMPHQTIGVAWALDREKSADRGGCLSDEMGLGKTVQIIAVMVANASGDPLCKSNLIVAPTALLDQWALEIETKTTSGMRCLIYHGPSKPKKRNELLKYDVVLTTYQTLALEWPDYEAEQKAKEKLMRMKKKGESFVVSDSDDDVKPKKRGKKKELGLLFTINWYRVILDEAQNIRNRKTRTSRSVTDLDSKYRWCLTGTPIINGLTDAYPLFRFLKFRPWYDWSEFNNHVAKYEKRNPNLASKRLQAMFQVMLLRRKKDSTLDGKKLIELPPKNVQLEKLAFSQEERDIYKMVEVRSQARFNRFLKAGTVLKNYTQVLVMLLRLRQICSHPALIQEQADALVSPTDLDLDGHQDIDAQNERARAMRLVSPDFVKRLRDRYRDAALARMEAERESADATADGEECPICMDTFTDAVVTPCTHAFCRECIVSVLDAPFAQDMDDPHKYRANERPCPSCRSAISADKLFSRGAFEPTDEELQGKPAPEKEVIDIDSDDEMLGISELVRRDAKGKGKRTRRAAYDSEDEQDEERDDDMSDFIVESDEDEEEKDARRALKKSLGKRRAMVVESDDEMDDVVIGAPRTQEALPTGPVKMMSKFLPSTKMKRMMEHLVRWAEANPGEKTIVISQWTECLKLVSDYLTENHMPHVKYQGSMSRAQRDQAVRAFMIGSKAEVMLMSLKCGGVGLNLTRANRVISLDLGWSEAIESQAFDRVHRLGQTKEVFVQRLVIADTVEDRVLALQERKKNLADGSLGEGTGKKIGRKIYILLARGSELCLIFPS
ncbi:hypothetical protein BV22DRAFT_1012721 [Leucogyrophana mollusca]|uniref:Uncharacterized protein n=1 Tax=Leucogyrophana mollusca TaxID=85980 RepID=A0ACB8BG57_9AGAM|nr:hypothetical protein BV22DRAFT_1012721 [Leucogyrophana mollusca]